MEERRMFVIAGDILLAVAVIFIGIPIGLSILGTLFNSALKPAPQSPQIAQQKEALAIFWIVWIPMLLICGAMRAPLLLFVATPIIAHLIVFYRHRLSKWLTALVNQA
jgi:hypothetical protein